MHKSQQLGCKNLLIVTAVIISNDGDERVLQTYTDGVSDYSLRTYLRVVPMKNRALTVYFVAFIALKNRKVGDGKITIRNLSNGKIAKSLALSLYGFSHLPHANPQTVIASGLR